MKEIRRTNFFEKWLKKLKDRIGKALIIKRIDRLAQGNPGDVKPVGEGCSEMRIDHGPGYRLYSKVWFNTPRLAARRLIIRQSQIVRTPGKKSSSCFAVEINLPRPGT
jgi:putative addiction module killer protein